MKYPRRVDENQSAIVKFLRDVGCSVLSLSEIGRGCPDLLVGFRGRNVLLEVKNPMKPKADRQLTSAEGKWIKGWRGQVAVVETVDDALRAVRESAPARTMAEVIPR